MCKQSGTQTSTVVQNPTVPEWLTTKFQDLSNRATDVSNRPYNPGTQKNVADFTADQLGGFQTVRNSQGVYAPFVDAATNFAAIGGSPVSNESIQNYMNPFTQNVIDASLANIQDNNEKQRRQMVGNAALQGGLGNDRLKLAQASLAGEQNLATNQTISNLLAQNYNQALGAGQQDRTAAQNAASQFSNLGGQLSNLMGQDASRLVQTGGLQQQLAQTQLDTTSQNIAQQEQYPFATTSWLGGMLQGASPTFTGSTQTQSSPGPSTLSQIAGIGLAGAGLLGLSDPRMKIDLGVVGEMNDGTPIHAFKYKNDPEGQTHFGPMADEVAKTNPEAVYNVDGTLYINADEIAEHQQNVIEGEYEDVTDRDGFNDGGFALGGNRTVPRYRNPTQMGSGGMQTPMGVSNVVPAASVQTGGLMQAMSPVKDKVSRPKAMFDEAKGIADDLRPMVQAGKGLGGLADQATRTFGGFSMKPQAYGPAVPDGLADGGRVGYAVGGMAQGPYGNPEFNPAAPSLYGMPVPAPQPAMRPIRPAGLGAAQFQMPTQAPDVGAPPGMNEMETLAAANGPSQSAGWQTTVQPTMETSPVGGQTPPAAGGFGFGNMSDAAKMAMIQAGLGMAAGTSPNALTNIGRGGMMGVQAYQSAKSYEARRAQEALQNRIAEEKLRMMTEEFKQRQAEYLENKPLREAQIATAQRNASEPGFERRQEIEREQAVKRIEAEREIKKQEAIQAGYGPETPEYKAHVFGMKGATSEKPMLLPEGGTLIDPRTGRVLAEGRPKGPDSTARKYIYEAQDELPGMQKSIEDLTRIRDLLTRQAPSEAGQPDTRPYFGVGSETMSDVNQTLPAWVPNVFTDPDRAKATQELNKLLSTQAIEAMSKALKGATTDTELKQFKELLADTKVGPEVKLREFDSIMRRAQREYQNRIDRIKELGGRMPTMDTEKDKPSVGAAKFVEKKVVNGVTYYKDAQGNWHAPAEGGN